MLKARSQLILDHAFFGSLAMRLRLVERNDISTMATDAVHLFYSRKFLDAMTPAFLLFAVAHEVLHCALGHCTRRGNRDHDFWNIACDHVVNLMLQAAGFAVPHWVYCDPRFKGMGAEEVYRILDYERKQKQQQQQPEPEEEDDDQEADQQDDDQPSGGSDNQDDDSDEDTKPDQPGDGESDDDSDDQSDDGGGAGKADDGDHPDDQDDGQSGGGAGTQDGDDPNPGKYPPSYGDPGGCGEVLDAAPEHDKATKDEVQDEWHVFTRQAAAIAKRQGEGRLPGFIEEILEDLNTPKTDWIDVVHNWFGDICQNKDYSTSKPNRRMMGLGYYIPGLVDDGINHVAIFIDSSISIDTAWLKKFGGEAQAVLDLGVIDKITVAFADTRVTKYDEYTPGQQIDWTVPGRGGTAFSPTFKWAEEHLPDLSAAIYFTDAECSDYGEAPPYPVLWAVYGSNPSMIKYWMDRIPWGESIELKD